MSGRPIAAGERFGRLLVVQRLDARAHQGSAMLVLQCDCGERFRRTAADLRSGKVRSCGCLRAELLRARSKQQAAATGEGSP